jgi:hypothetical protein
MRCIFLYIKHIEEVCVLNFPLAITQIGYSGSTGEEFIKPKIQDHIKSLVKFLLYRLNIFHP